MSKKNKKQFYGTSTDVPKEYCHHVKRYLRLRLGGVISQGNIFTLDFVETLLTEVVPVSKKPIFW